MRINKKKIIVFAILTILVVPILINHLIKSKYASEYSNREKAVVLIENGSARETEATIIDISDCRDSVVDYHPDKRTILYINTDNQVVEKFVDTGKTQIIDIEEVKNSLPIENDKIDKEIRNLQYGPLDKQVSFTYNGMLYLYNLKTAELVKVTECCSSNRRNTYEWIDQGEVVVRGYSEIDLELFLYNNLTQRKTHIGNGPISFVRDGEHGKIYAVVVEPKSHAFGFELIHKLAEINVEDGNEKVFRTIETNNLNINYDENFLYHVEERADQRKYKLYRINLEAGEQECIYKTDKIIVGIVVE